MNKIWVLAASALLSLPLFSVTAAAEGSSPRAEFTDAPDLGGEAEALADPQLREQVKQALISEPTTDDASAIKVSVKNGRVILSGTVDTEEERQLVLSKVERVAGLGNVVDKMRVRESVREE